MRAESLRLQNLRNHADTIVKDLSPRINVLAGPNGAGKTSVLEALSVSTLTKSFTTHSDAILIRKDQPILETETMFFSDLDVPHRVAIQIALGPPLKKSIFANSERLRSSSELVGRAPVVVLTPDDKVITNGPPAERRRFLNMVLSQASRTYLEDEMEYRRAVKQRNSILADARQQRRSLSYIQPFLSPWTTLVIKHGARIMRRRANFAEEFRGKLLSSYQLLSASREEPSIEYQPMGLPLPADPNLETILIEQQRIVELEELRRGSTLIGPHRDELVLYINPGHEAKHYASQGQHKTLLVSMKLAEFEYLREATHETPILLLDDVFSELDEHRAHQLLELAQDGDLGQTFITSTTREIFEDALDFAGGDHKLLIAESGSIRDAYTM